VKRTELSVERLPDNPIIAPQLAAGLGSNICGPSLIRVPPWVEGALGRYYLYFADHKGDHIRLAYADAVEGPWRIHPPGSLWLADSCFPTTPPAVTEDSELARQAAAAGSDFARPHIASPDLHVLEEAREIRMYFHGLLENGQQRTRVAVSGDGIRFRARPEVLALPYLRVFQLDGWTYGMSMPGIFYRSRDGLTDFEPGPRLFDTDMRHSALRHDGSTLLVFWTRVGDAPERILCSQVSLTGDWSTWQASEPVEVLRPTESWEGSDLPVEPSRRGEAHGRVHQLRDPAIFEDDGRSYLLYAGAGESCIGIARIHFGG